MQSKEYKQKSQIYFQTQGLSLLCGLHAVNNFLSRQQYTRKTMNEICYKLSDDFINPHKHFLFGGDYDVNVLIYSLDLLKFDVEWHDKRKMVQEQILNECQGFLVNIQYPKRCYHRIFCTSNRHWISVKARQNDYLYLDSNQQHPKIFNKGQLIKKLNEIRQKQNGEILKINHKKNGKQEDYSYFKTKE